MQITPEKNIKKALLAAKLAKESLELLTMQDAELCRMQFRQIIADLKELDEHLKTL
jgi:hypothetical protein